VIRVYLTRQNKERICKIALFGVKVFFVRLGEKVFRVTGSSLPLPNSLATPQGVNSPLLVEEGEMGWNTM
jgi:hypothetical protein